MRRNRTILGILVAAAVMMAATGCSSKDAAATPTDTTEVTTQAVETTTAKESTTSEESTDEETMEEETTEEETTASDAGTLGSDGVFKPASGKFEITPPSDWKLEGSSDDQYITFTKEAGEDMMDMLEVVCLSGEDAEGMVETFPESGDEYMKLVSRGDDGSSLVNYDVKTSDDGSQTFKYAMKFTNPSDGVRYMAVSGSYDVSTGNYCSVTATVMTEGTDAAAQKAVDSFIIK